MDIITIIGLVGGLALGAGAVVAAEQNKKKEEGPKKKKSSEKSSENTVKSDARNTSDVVDGGGEAQANASSSVNSHGGSTVSLHASSSVSAAMQVEKLIIKEEKAELQSLEAQKKKIGALINGIFALESAIRKLNEEISDETFIDKMKKPDYAADFSSKISKLQESISKLQNQAGSIYGDVHDFLSMNEEVFKDIRADFEKYADFRRLFSESEQNFILDAANAITPAWSGSCNVAKKLVGLLGKCIELCDEMKKSCSIIFEGHAQHGFKMMFDEEQGFYVLFGKHIQASLENAIIISKIMADADNVLKQVIKITAEKEKMVA